MKSEKAQLIDNICPVCNKSFIPAGLHSYKDKRSGKRVCSWHCVLESERLNEANIKEKSTKGAS